MRLIDELKPIMKTIDKNGDSTIALKDEMKRLWEPQSMSELLKKLMTLYARTLVPKASNDTSPNIRHYHEKVRAVGGVFERLLNQSISDQAKKATLPERQTMLILFAINILRVNPVISNDFKPIDDFINSNNQHLLAFLAECISEIVESEGVSATPTADDTWRVMGKIERISNKIIEVSNRINMLRDQLYSVPGSSKSFTQLFTKLVDFNKVDKAEMLFLETVFKAGKLSAFAQCQSREEYEQMTTELLNSHSGESHPTQFEENPFKPSEDEVKRQIEELARFEKHAAQQAHRQKQKPHAKHHRNTHSTKHPVEVHGFTAKSRGRTRHAKHAAQLPSQNNRKNLG